MIASSSTFMLGVTFMMIVGGHHLKRITIRSILIYRMIRNIAHVRGIIRCMIFRISHHGRMSTRISIRTRSHLSVMYCSRSTFYIFTQFILPFIVPLHVCFITFCAIICHFVIFLLAFRILALAYSLPSATNNLPHLFKGNFTILFP